MLDKNLLNEIMREPSAARRVSCVSFKMQYQVIDMAEHTDLLKRAKAYLLSFFPASERGLKELLRVESSISDSRVYEYIPIAYSFAACTDYQQVACLLAAAYLARIKHDLPELRRVQDGLLAVGQFEQAHAVQRYMQLNFGTMSSSLRGKLLRRALCECSAKSYSYGVYRSSLNMEKTTATRSFLEEDLYRKLVVEQGATYYLPRFVRTAASYKSQYATLLNEISGFTIKMPSIRVNLQTFYRFVDETGAQQQ